MKHYISIIFLLLISQFAFAETYSLTARVYLIEKDYLYVDGNAEKFMLVNKHSPTYTRMGSSFKTTYIIAGGQKTSFETLEMVGYITKAKITVQDNLVKEIIVLDMQQ